MIFGIDLYDSYEELNAELESWSWVVNEKPAPFSNDRNVEDPRLIVGVRKWSWDDIQGHPLDRVPMSCLVGLEMMEHVKVGDKYDVFIYTE